MSAQADQAALRAAVFGAITDQVNTGLGQVDQLAVGRGFVDAHAGFSSSEGAFGRLEAGFKPATDLDLFGFGEASTGQGVQAGIGARWSF